MLVRLSAISRGIRWIVRQPLRRFYIARTIAACPETCWRVISDMELWLQWGPSIRDVQPRGLPLRSGLHGRVLTVAGIWLPFEITEVTEGRSWEWRVLGIPATAHLVQPVGPQHSRVSFGIPILALPYAIVCAIALRRIERLTRNCGRRKDLPGCVGSEDRSPRNQDSLPEG